MVNVVGAVELDAVNSTDDVGRIVTVEVTWFEIPLDSEVLDVDEESDDKDNESVGDCVRDITAVVISVTWKSDDEVTIVFDDDDPGKGIDVVSCVDCSGKEDDTSDCELE